MAKLDAYLPIDRRFALTRDVPLPDRTTGAVLFADISGFSSIATALEQELGSRQGADQLMMQVNMLYTGLIGEVHRYGGSVINFSGDAITCWFDEQIPRRDAPSSAPGNSAQRATACALSMQEVVGRTEAWRQADRSTGPVSALSIKVSVVAGSVRRFLSGSPQIQLVEVLAGELLDRSAAAEKELQPGQVVVGAEVLGRFGRQLEVSEWVAGSNGEYFALVSRLVEAVDPHPWPELPALAAETARPWLLPPIYRRLQRGEEEFLAELRPSVALFLQFSGIDYDGDDNAGEKLDAFVRWVQRVLQPYGGYLLQVSVGDKGSYILASTSATMTHEDDALRAVAATEALLLPPPELSFIVELKAGISWGTMLVGAYGSDIRRAFSEQGSETNLAVRLMERAAPGQILVSAAVAEATRAAYELRDVGALRLKGWAKEIPAFTVERRRRPLVRDPEKEPEKAPIIGRHDELTLFRKCITAMRQGRSSAIVIEGEAGIGKSRLVDSYLQEAKTATVRALLGSGDAIERATPFHAWRLVIRDVLQLGPNETQAAVCERITAALLEQNGNVEQAALLDNMLALSRVEDRLVIGTENRVGVDKARELLLGILGQRANGSGQVLILDDAQWIDSASWALLNDVRQAFMPLLIVVATRPVREDALLPKELEALIVDPDTVRLDLAALAPEESTTLVAQRLGVRSLPEAVVSFIRQRAGGHPFLSEEIAYALIDAGILQIHDGESRLVTKNGDLDHLDFPDSMQGVITSRINRLQAPTQLTLKVASVIGPTFTFDNLYDVHPVPADRENLHEHLDELARLDMAVADTSEGEATYVFTHALIQEIAYGRLLNAQRRQLHQAVADWLEKTYATNLDPLFPRLAYHWGRAAEARAGAEGDKRLTEKALNYMEKSGEQALQNSAYREAISFFTQALTLGAKPAVEVPDARWADWLRQLGEAYHIWGQWSEARNYLAQAAALYGRPLPASQTGVVWGIPWQALIQMRNRLWPGRYVGRAGEDDKEAILKVAHIYQTLSELSFLTNDSAFSLYAVLYALNLSEYGGLSPELVKAYTDICVIVGLFGPQKMAEGYARQAWDTAQAFDEAAIKVAAQTGIGLSQMNAGKLAMAQASFEEALSLSKALGDRRLWGESLGLLARTIYFQGDLERSEKLYAELGGPRSGVMMHRVWALTSQATVALRKGELDAALGFLDEVRNLPGEQPEPTQEISIWAYLGLASLRQGDRAQAEEAAGRAVALMEEMKASAYTHFESMAAGAEVYLSLWEEGQEEGVPIYKTEARKLCDLLRRGTVKMGRPAAWLYRGWYNWLDGHPRRAYKHWGKGLAAALEMDMPYEKGCIHLEIGRHAPVGSPEREKHLRQAQDIFNRIGANYQLDQTEAVLER